jgi:hypothetical protein
MSVNRENDQPLKHLPWMLRSQDQRTSPAAHSERNKPEKSSVMALR